MGLSGWCEGGVKANTVGLDVIGSPTKKTNNNKPINQKGRTSPTVTMRNNHVTIVAFLLELGICTRADNCGAFTDNPLGKSGVDVRGGGRSKGVRLSLGFPG